ncbi:MAG: InlB B-repeat-containing protein [Verrucomicrobiota bacterium]
MPGLHGPPGLLWLHEPPFVAAPGVELPPRSTVDTVAAPLDGETTTGSGTYPNGSPATVAATPAAGLALVDWSGNGRVVSRSAAHTFTNLTNRSLVAHSGPDPARLTLVSPPADTHVLAWPANAVGYLPQWNASLFAAHGVDVTHVPTVAGTNAQVVISPLTGGESYFRLRKP